MYKSDGGEILNENYSQFYQKYYQGLLAISNMDYKETMSGEKVSILERFTGFWKNLARNADDYSKKWTKAVSERIFDFRFYSVPSSLRTLDLGVFTESDFLNEKSGQVTVLQSICDTIEHTKSLEESKKNPSDKIQCKFFHLVKDKFNQDDYAIIGNHPLGFYMLLMKKDKLKVLIQTQCDGQYYRNIPSTSEVRDFNQN